MLNKQVIFDKYSMQPLSYDSYLAATDATLNFHLHQVSPLKNTQTHSLARLPHQSLKAE